MDVELDRSLLGTKLRVRAKSPFFSVLGGHLRPLQVPDDDPIQTAATDSKYLYINKRFWMSLRPEERDFVFVHEVLHAALGHCWRADWRIPIKYNVAADYVVNLVCGKAGYAPLASALYDYRYDAMTVEEVYALLPDPFAGGCPGCGAGESGDVLGQDIKPAAGADQRAEAARWRAAIARAREAERMFGQGNSPFGNLLKFHEEQSTIKWQSALWKVFDNELDFGGFDRRLIWSETYVEDLIPIDNSLGLSALCVDTSGSTGDVLGKFIGEIKEIASMMSKPFPLYYSDAALIGPLPLEELDRPIGGGGTSFVPFFEEVERQRYEKVVFFTDLMGTFPNRTDADVLWVVPPGITIAPPFGRVVKIV